MRHNTSVTTLAAAIALALALLLGVLLPSDSVVHAAGPEFVSGAGTRSVSENTPPGVNIGAPISATDSDEIGSVTVVAVEFGDTLTYSLSGTDADKFDIDASTGQLITKAPLDFEKPRGGTDGDSNEYVVTVTVKDSSGTSVTQPVIIEVTGVSEEPGAPAAPTVVSTDSDGDADTFELKVIWYPPDDPGDGVTEYDVQYKETTKTSFLLVDTSPAVTTVTITGLDDDTPYQVRVRATNAVVGDGPWSLSSVGATNKEDNALPSFGDGTVERNVLENSDPGLVVGFKVSATDDDNVLPLTYQLHGPDANSFDLQASTGQIRTKRGVVYDFETKDTLNVTMTVSDRQGGTDAKAVTINITDVPEAPSTPARPTVRATPGSSRSLDVSWTAPDNTGPAITGYDIRYREGNRGGFTLIPPAGTGTTATIAPADINLADGDNRLTPGSSYEVYVRAQNGESPSEWSAAGTGRTSIGNSDSTFDDRSSLTETDPTTDRTVAENTRAGQSVGRAVRAVDGNGDKRTYRLVAADDATHVAKFDINPTTGQILTKDPLNHEEADCGYVDAPSQTTCTYTVKVQVWDGLDEDRNEQDTSSLDDADDTNDTDIIDDTITVNIMVSDVAEKPAAPTVTVTSPTDAGTTSLVVTWDEPANAGPAITGYRLECTGHEVPDDQCPLDISASEVSDGTGTRTIAELTADKDYRVRMRADNAEGQGAWSIWVTQSTNKENNTLPTFTSPPDALYVVENAASARQPLTALEGTVTNIQTNDTDGDSPLTLRLEGPDAGRFHIVASTGQIRTRSKLNHEDPDCYDSEADPTTCSYSVRVKLSDPNGGSAFHPLTINVTDNDGEAPKKPAAPRVTATSGSGWSLQVTWIAPLNDGPPITGYQIRYRKTGDNTALWRQWAHTGTGRSAKITTIPVDGTDLHLEPRTQYEVQVRALNGEGDPDSFEVDPNDNWSKSGRGTTGASNERPVFDSTLLAVVELEVEENTRSGQNVGSAIEATDPDKNRLTYTLEGPGKDSFTITSTGQVRTRSPLNYEERDEYSLTVKVNDGQRKNNSVAAKSVTIEVTDRPEQPSAPGAPRVSGIPGSTVSVRVTWDEPTNMGPPITHYSVQYAVSGSRDAFVRVTVPHGAADRSVVITGLTSGTRYDVQVRAEVPGNHSAWSRSGTGSPNPDVANRNPAFSSRSHTFNVAENTPPGADVGSLVAALDPDGDTLTYTLEGVDADSFDIIATNGAGQIQTKATLNHEEKASYSVAVRARDGRGGTDAVNVTIRVTDVNDEAPDTPFAPTVVALSSTSLQVSWEKPENTGPPITDYDYRYSASSGPWTEVTNTTIRDTTITVEGLTPSTSYDVEVRAKNAEGASDWSNPGNGATNEPGANNPPVFTEGTSATRSVSAGAPSGTLIGDPVSATDADSDDTLEYSLEGRDAGNFEINETNGQLRTRTGITLLVGETYTVTVVADDTKDRAEITVTIEATAAPPNAVPAFTEGAATTRSVFEGTPSGTSIGSPVTATDADTGDTVTYSLEGTDASSFAIVASSGQIQTRAALDASTKATYTVTVVASDEKARATITVTITVTARPNSPPVFSEGVSTTRSVVGPVAPFTEIGSPVVATDDDDDTLRYSLEGTDAASFTIDPFTGQLLTRIALTVDTKATYTVTVVASDGEASSRITVTINVTPPPNNVPVFNEGPTATRSVRDDAARGSSIGSPVTATDADTGDTVTYSLEGTDASSFAIVASSGQIQTRAALDASTKATYTVTVVASDEKARATITVTITVTARPNSPPVFSEGVSTTRSVVGPVAPFTEIGSPVVATDDDDDTLRYSLEGTDAASFTIDPFTGQLLTRIALTVDTKATYTVTVVASDGEASSRITVTINVTPPPNNVPVFNEGPTATRSVRDDAARGSSIGSPVTATDADAGDTVTYSLEGTDAASFDIVASSGQIQTRAALDASTKATYTVTVVASDEKARATITVTITVTARPNSPPVFSEGVSTTRSVVGPVAPFTEIGSPVVATDDDDDTLRYSLEGTDAASFTIDPFTGQLLTRIALTVDTKATYTVTVVASDGEAEAAITVTINVTPPPNNVPVFNEGPTATRSVRDDAARGSSIGSPVTATDADAGDTVTYSLEGTDAASFDIVASSGQIQTRAALDASTKATYTVTVVASDGKARATITVTITVTVRPNSPPVFSEGVSTTRSVVEPVAPFTEIGSPVVATDADDDTLTYTIGGTDAASFFIDPSTGQLFTRIALTVDTKATYTVTVVASDGEAEAAITVTINVTPPPNNVPVFNEGPSATRSVRDDARPGANIGTPVTATDADAGDTITYSLGGTNAASFAIVASSGQIQASAALDASTKSTYSVIVVASDGKGRATINVTITVTAAPTSFGCATNGAVADASNTGLVADCEALLRARDALEGSARLNWSAFVPITNWEGVYLRGTPARVTWLIIRRRGLDGTVPAELGQLDMLTQLNLHSNSLSGSIPDEIGNLRNLQRLLLHNNSLSGDFPDLRRLNNLTHLWLSGTNQRVGMGNDIPAWLNGLTNLEELNLWGNEIGGDIPNLSGLSNLKILKLQNNSLTGSIPAWFGNMNSLGGLYLHANDLNGAIPPELGRLTRLRRLWLDRNELEGIIPPALSGMSNLGTLNLHTNRLTGTIPPQLGNLSRLQHLGLHNNVLTGIIPAQLGHLGELTRLAVSNNRLTGTIPSELGDLDKLTLLWLSQNQLTGTIPSDLGDLGDTLTSIKLASNNFDSDACVPSGLANVRTNDYSEAGLSTCTN